LFLAEPVSVQLLLVLMLASASLALVAALCAAFIDRLRLL
jgi:MFS transporter, DHA1 family, multidrug resistance protein